MTLGDDQPVIGHGDAVGEAQIPRQRRHVAIRRDADHATARVRRHTPSEIEAKIAHEASSRVVDDHVVDRPARDAREIGILGGAPVRVLQQAPLEHRGDDRLARGQEAQPGGDIRQLAHDVVTSVEIHGEKRAGQAVDEPEPAVVPARRLEVSAGDERGFHDVAAQFPPRLAAYCERISTSSSEIGCAAIVMVPSRSDAVFSLNPRISLRRYARS